VGVVYKNLIYIVKNEFFKNLKAYKNLICVVKINFSKILIFYE
jgi:hypothetical protein